jgi:hypothetical protein
VKTLLIVGLALTVAGAFLLAWPELTAGEPTYESLLEDWRWRRRFARVGFPAIAVGTALQIVAVALD